MLGKQFTFWEPSKLPNSKPFSTTLDLVGSVLRSRCMHPIVSIPSTCDPLALNIQIAPQPYHYKYHRCRHYHLKHLHQPLHAYLHSHLHHRPTREPQTLLITTVNSLIPCLKKRPSTSGLGFRREGDCSVVEEGGLNLEASHVDFVIYSVFASLYDVFFSIIHVPPLEVIKYFDANSPQGTG